MYDNLSPLKHLKQILMEGKSNTEMYLFTKSKQCANWTAVHCLHSSPRAGMDTPILF